MQQAERLQRLVKTVTWPGRYVGHHVGISNANQKLCVEEENQTCVRTWDLHPSHIYALVWSLTQTIHDSLITTGPEQFVSKSNL